MSNPLRAELLRTLTERSYQKKRVTLASGRESDFFIDCKQSVLLGSSHVAVGSLMGAAALRIASSLVAVAGVELGGCSLASAVAMHFALSGHVCDAVYVRKGAKDHGSKRLLEGSDGIVRGSTVVVLEDVITTGGSTRSAVAILRAAGFVVPGVVVLVDRQEGGREALEAAELKVESIYQRSDFPS